MNLRNFKNVLLIINFDISHWNRLVIHGFFSMFIKFIVTEIDDLHNRYGHVHLKYHYGNKQSVLSKWTETDYLTNRQQQNVFCIPFSWKASVSK